MDRHSIFSAGLAIVIVVAAASGAVAFSWDALTPARITGISLDKPLTANVLDYTLVLGDSPTITLGGQTFGIDWVQAFHVAGSTPDVRFTATDGSGPLGWSWDSKSSPGQVSGWVGQGSNRLLPGQSAGFSFGAFDPGSSVLMPAYHIGYRDGNRAFTGWYSSPPEVPPGGVVPESPCFLLVAVGLAAFALGQRRRSRTPITHLLT